MREIDLAIDRPDPSTSASSRDPLCYVPSRTVEDSVAYSTTPPSMAFEAGLHTFDDLDSGMEEPLKALPVPSADELSDAPTGTEEVALMKALLASRTVTVDLLIILYTHGVPRAREYATRSGDSLDAGQIPESLTGAAAVNWTIATCNSASKSTQRSRYTPPEEPAGVALPETHLEGNGRTVPRSVVENYYASRSHAVLRRHIELEMFRLADVPARHTALQVAELKRSRPKYSSPPPVSLLQMLKRHSIINDIFFRPPKPHYTSAHKDLIMLRLTHHKPLPALWLPQDKPCRGVLIFAHSNACDISQNPIIETYRVVYNVSVLAPEWPGYGLATGVPTEEGLTSTLMDVVMYVNTVMLVPFSRIILFGRSLATGPCAEVAALLQKQGFPLGGLIMKSGYLSWRRAIAEAGEAGSVVRKICSCASELFLDRFRVYDVIRHVSCPTLFIHGKLDKVVKHTHSVELYNLVGSKPDEKVLCLVDTGCHDYGIEVWDVSKKFVSSLALGADPCVLPFLRTFPDEVYEVDEWCEKAVKERKMRQLLRTVRWGLLGVVGLAALVFGCYIAIADDADMCDSILHVAMIVHGVTVISGALLYLAADWMQEDLHRAQDPDVQFRCLAFLVFTVIMFITDAVLVHVALGVSFDTSEEKCRPLYWWTSFAFVASTMYVYILQALITNK